MSVGKVQYAIFRGEGTQSRVKIDYVQREVMLKN